MLPEITSIHGFAIPTYGALYLFAFAASLWLLGPLARKEGLAPSRVRMCAVYCVVISRVASSLIDAAVNGMVFSFTIVAKSTGAFFWALIPGLIFIVAYTHFSGMPTLKVLDCASPPLVLAQAIGRLGCFAAGCCFGIPTQSWLGVTYTDPRAHALSEVPLDIPLHPVQLYDAAISLGILSFLLWLYPRRSFPGQVFSIMLMATSIGRLLSESFRGDIARGFLYDGISIPRFLAALILALAFPLYFWSKAKHPKAHLPQRND